jgi:hypothetical protein
MATDQDNARDFDSLTPVEEPNRDDDGEDDWVDSSELEEPGFTLVGEVVRIDENMGQHNSRLYEIRVDLGHTRLLWGRASINRKVDAAGIGPGDVIGIRNTGDTFETDNGTGYEYDVRVLEDSEEEE